MAAVPRFMLSHRHEPQECRVAFASWHGYESPLRRQSALASCEEGGHSLWWTVDAESQADALAQLPPYVAERTDASRVSEVPIP